jgi:hypothetical protein
MAYQGGQQQRAPNLRPCISSACTAPALPARCAIGDPVVPGYLPPWAVEDASPQFSQLFALLLCSQADLGQRSAH